MLAVGEKADFKMALQQPEEATGPLKQGQAEGKTVNKKTRPGAEEMAQLLRALAPFVEDLNAGPSSSMMAHNHP